jgi:hypothetical protein
VRTIRPKIFREAGQRRGAEIFQPGLLNTKLQIAIKFLVRP